MRNARLTSRSSVPAKRTTKASPLGIDAPVKRVNGDALTIRRIGAPSRFRYRRDRGGAVRDKATLERIRTLAIPPAWTDVRIAASARAHLQAVGIDARGRKQYRYHPGFRARRDEEKYEHLLRFAKLLPRIRERVRRDLRRRGIPRDKVLALVVRLLEATLIRVGNGEYAQKNGSYGLTTMRDRHAGVRGQRVWFTFKGKSNIRHRIELEDPRLARIIKRCRDLPGQELFQYQNDNGDVLDISSGDVNDYLRRITGKEITAKDFRTWAGTVLAAEALHEFEQVVSKAQAKRSITRAIEKVSKRLGNTPSICKKCYVHPAVLNGYLDGQLVDLLEKRTAAELRKRLRGLSPTEAAVLAFLHDSLSRRAQCRART